MAGGLPGEQQAEEQCQECGSEGDRAVEEHPELTKEAGGVVPKFGAGYPEARPAEGEGRARDPDMPCEEHSR